MATRSSNPMPIVAGPIRSIHLDPVPHARATLARIALFRARSSGATQGCRSHSSTRSVPRAYINTCLGGTRRTRRCTNRCPFPRPRAHTDKMRTAADFNPRRLNAACGKFYDCTTPCSEVRFTLFHFVSISLSLSLLLSRSLVYTLLYFAIAHFPPGADTSYFSSNYFSTRSESQTQPCRCFRCGLLLYTADALFSSEGAPTRLVFCFFWRGEWSVAYTRQQRRPG